MTTETKFTENVGNTRKMDQDGTFLNFPGNTILCDLSRHKQVVMQVGLLQNFYRTLSFGHKFAFTPPASLHMTVIEMLCHYQRTKEQWSSYLNLDIPLDETDRFFSEKLHSLAFPDNFRMKLKTIQGTTIVLEPDDEETAVSLRSFRDSVARLTGVRFPGHDSYKFHISFGYKWMKTTEEEDKELSIINERMVEHLAEHIGTINTGPVLFTVFESMTLFVPYHPDARSELRGLNGWDLTGKQS